MDDYCTCGVKFRTGEDYRDHLPCPGTQEQQTIAELRSKLAAAEKRAERAEANTNIAISWRRCPSCGLEYPHLAVTSNLSCGTCRVGKVMKERDELQAKLIEAETEAAWAYNVAAGPDIPQNRREAVDRCLVAERNRLQHLRNKLATAERENELLRKTQKPWWRRII